MWFLLFLFLDCNRSLKSKVEVLSIDAIIEILQDKEWDWFTPWHSISKQYIHGSGIIHYKDSAVVAEVIKSILPFMSDRVLPLYFRMRWPDNYPS